MLNGSVSKLVEELCHKTLKFSIPVFTDFVKKTRRNDEENLDFLCNNGIAFVEKFENPPNAPQIRPI